MDWVRLSSAIEPNRTHTKIIVQQEPIIGSCCAIELSNFWFLNSCKTDVEKQYRVFRGSSYFSITCLSCFRDNVTRSLLPNLIYFSLCSSECIHRTIERNPSDCVRLYSASEPNRTQCNGFRVCSTRLPKQNLLKSNCRLHGERFNPGHNSARAEIPSPVLQTGLGFSARPTGQ